MLEFGLHVSDIGFVELLYICVEIWLGISMVNKFQYFVITKMAS